MPDGIRTLSASSPVVTTMVLVRHGEAECNVSGVCGGRIGCTGLTELGRKQVEQLRDRLMVSAELAKSQALYASVLPRAIETAELLVPALGSENGAPLTISTDCGLCELHPGEADGLTWEEYSDRFPTPDWDTDPGQVIAPGGESWAGFVKRVAVALDDIAHRHESQLVVLACHAGVIEASLLAKLPVFGGLDGARLQLRTAHASMTTWEIDRRRWRLLGYNERA